MAVLNETDRVDALRQLQLLDTPPEAEFDAIVRLAAVICDMPVAAVSLVDEDRQWFKAKLGLAVDSTPRDWSLCSRAIQTEGMLIVPDASADIRFQNSPLVRGEPFVRFYAGQVLRAPNGLPVGALCVVDRKPRTLTNSQIESLKELGRQAEVLMALRQSKRRLEIELNERLHVQRELEQTCQTLSTLHQIAQSISGAMTSAELARLIVQSVMNSSGAERAAVVFNRLDGSGLDVYCPPGGEADRWDSIIEQQFPRILNLLCGQSTGNWEELSKVDAPLASQLQQAGLPIRSLLIAPVSGVNGQCQGAILLGHSQGAYFTPFNEKLLAGVATQTAVALENTQLIARLQQTSQEMAYQSLHDSLTGLPNRTLFASRVDQCLSRANRCSSSSFALLLLNIDRFQLFNDSLGYDTGDEVLKLIAKRLAACLSVDSRSGTDTELAFKVEFVARLVGDEFAILLENIQTPHEAARVGLHLLDALAEPLQVGGAQLSVVSRMGISTYQPAYRTADEMLRDADVALHRAKMSPHLRYAVFDPSMHVSVINRMRLESDLRNAIDSKELKLAYQPLVCLRTHRVIGFEALLRWMHDGRMISPADFIPVAEETGVIVPIGRWVLMEACRQIAEWRQTLRGMRECTVSVNLSRRQITETGLLHDVTTALAVNNLQADALKLEITESAVMTDIGSAQEVLSSIQSMGVRLSMDDFGTGYSSLACLHEFALDELKIDRGFLKNASSRRESSAVLNAIVNLAHHFGIKVVAEGLETADQVVLLQTLECDVGQGYYFAKPLLPEQVEAWVGSYVSNVSKCA